jgi:hypothetical protein
LNDSLPTSTSVPKSLPRLIVPDLGFRVEGAGAVLFAATPLLGFALRIDNVPAAEVIHTVTLHCQIQIEATRRHYAPEEQTKLADLFGEPERWSRTLRSLLWTHVSLVVPRFKGSTIVELQVPCTFDFNVATTKYFSALADGDIPVCFLFSGTAFYEDGESRLQVSPIPWEKEARFRLPVSTWRKVIDAYYPNTAWLCLRRDVFDRLHAYKTSRGVPTWEQAIEDLLPAPGTTVPS